MYIDNLLQPAYNGNLRFWRGMGKLADNVKWKHFNPVSLNSILLSTGELFFSIKKNVRRNLYEDCTEGLSLSIYNGSNHFKSRLVEKVRKTVLTKIIVRKNSLTSIIYVDFILFTEVYSECLSSFTRGLGRLKVF